MGQNPRKNRLRKKKINKKMAKKLTSALENFKPKEGETVANANQRKNRIANHLAGVKRCL